MPRNKPFEIPQELRQLAEENVERARQLYLQFIESVAQTMAVWGMPPSDTITSGFDRVRARAVRFAKENADAAFKLAREIANAKDLQELLSLQTRYVQSQMRWYADQTQEFGQLMAGALGSMEASAGAVVSQTLTHVDPPEDVTSLKLTGFSIEVDTDPVTLLMQTDKGPFSVEISKTELSNLVYALQIVSYADEPLQQKRLKRQAEARSLYGSVGDPTKAREATPIKSSRRAKERKGKKQK